MNTNQLSIIIWNCILILLFQVNSASTAMAQDKQPYIIKGYLGIQGGETFSYVLELWDSTDTHLKGFAYTYSEQHKDVKATIVATINRPNRTIIVHEKNIVHNHGFTSQAVICLLETDLIWNEKEKNLTGKILTKTVGSGSLPCSKGSLHFSNEQEINNLFHLNNTIEAPINNNITKPSKPTVDPNKPITIIDRTKEKNVIMPVTTMIKKVEITEGKDEVIQWMSNEIELHIWDGNTIDGDIITILFNGKTVLDNFTLTSTPKILKLPIGGNELNIITILAGNEGGEPPNTANIKLIDGDNTYPIVAHNKVGKKAIIKIKKTF